MVWFLIISAALLLAGLFYWLLVVTEGVFLGRRAVVWLYDITAYRYDAIKEFDDADDQAYIGRRLAREVRGNPAAVLLDVATGTGRVPLTLMKEPEFQGFIVGLDAAGKMLAEALKKMTLMGNTAQGQIGLVKQTAVPLPFADDTFDAVSCLEALEFFPSDQKALEEMARVLKPGGMLMTSRRRGLEAKSFLGRYRSRANFEALLFEIGFHEICTSQWEVDYELVTARKPGTV